jgi:putative FmdB family regulatory protein
MPYFDGVCWNCGHRFEDNKKWYQVLRCPVCHSVARRIFPRVNFTFGFRLTDRSHNVKWAKDEFERDV